MCVYVLTKKKEKKRQSWRADISEKWMMWMFALRRRRTMLEHNFGIKTNLFKRLVFEFMLPENFLFLKLECFKRISTFLDCLFQMMSMRQANIRQYRVKGHFQSKSDSYPKYGFTHFEILPALFNSVILYSFRKKKGGKDFKYK